jgi:hypothetical protein
MFKTNINGHTYDKTYEKNTKPSETIPDQSMSVKELMQRHAQGLPLGGERVPIYNGETDLPDMYRMDLAEREELINGAKDELDQLTQKSKTQEKLKTEQKQAALFNQADQGDKVDAKSTPKKLPAEGAHGVPPEA